MANFYIIFVSCLIVVVSLHSGTALPFSGEERSTERSTVTRQGAFGGFGTFFNGFLTGVNVALQGGVAGADNLFSGFGSAANNTFNGLLNGYNLTTQGLGQGASEFIGNTSRT